MENIITNFLQSVVRQDKQLLRQYFANNAEILWHNTNEKFSVEEYLTANCEYGGNWCGEVERIDQLQGQYVAVSKVSTVDEQSHYRVVSYFTFSQDKIVALHEYWGECDVAPQWRQDMSIGQPIH